MEFLRRTLARVIASAVLRGRPDRSKLDLFKVGPSKLDLTTLDLSKVELSKALLACSRQERNG